MNESEHRLLRTLVAEHNDRCASTLLLHTGRDLPETDSHLVIVRALNRALPKVEDTRVMICLLGVGGEWVEVQPISVEHNSPIGLELIGYGYGFSEGRQHRQRVFRSGRFAYTESILTRCTLDLDPGPARVAFTTFMTTYRKALRRVQSKLTEPRLTGYFAYPWALMNRINAVGRYGDVSGYGKKRTQLSGGTADRRGFAALLGRLVS